MAVSCNYSSPPFSSPSLPSATDTSYLQLIFIKSLQCVRLWVKFFLVKPHSLLVIVLWSGFSYYLSVETNIEMRNIMYERLNNLPKIAQLLRSSDSFWFSLILELKFLTTAMFYCQVPIWFQSFLVISSLYSVVHVCIVTFD